MNNVVYNPNGILIFTKSKKLFTPSLESVDQENIGISFSLMDQTLKIDDMKINEKRKKMLKNSLTSYMFGGISINVFLT